MNINMKRKKLFTAICLTAGLLLAGCTKDDVTDDNTLPEGKYPLQIASVTMSVESSEQPWGARDPQTRMSENTENGNSSQWDGKEVISVQISGTLSGGTPYSDVGQYEVSEDKKNVTVKEAAYWHSKNNADITAWYVSPTNEDGTVNLANQQSKLAYVLQATSSNVTFGTSPSLNFNHRLAKVRIVLDGDQATQVDQLAVYGYTACTNNQGAVGVDDMTQGWINMKQTTYANGSKCWEANVVPGYQINKVQVNGIEVTLTTAVTPNPANVHEIIIMVGKALTIDLNELQENIYTVGEYRSVIIDGKGTALDKTIIIKNGATVTLKDVVLEPVTTTGNNYLNLCGIDVQGNAKIILEGTNSIANKSMKDRTTAIQIKDNQTLTIEGDGTLNLTIADTPWSVPLWLRSNANLIINSGTIVADATRARAGSYAVGIGSSGVFETFGSINY